MFRALFSSRSGLSPLKHVGALLACAALAWGAAPISDAQAQDSTPPAPAPLKVAIIDTQKVLHDTEEGIRIEANLHKMFDVRQAELVSREKSLQAEYDEIMKEEKAKSKADVIERKKADWRQKANQHQQAVVAFQREFTAKQNELYGKMVQRVNQLVESYAKRESIDVVLEKQAAVYFRRDLDITERIIQLYNAGDANASKEAPKKEAPKKEAPAKQPSN